MCLRGSYCFPMLFSVMEVLQRYCTAVSWVNLTLDEQLCWKMLYLPHSGSAHVVLISQTMTPTTSLLRVFFKVDVTVVRKGGVPYFNLTEQFTFRKWLIRCLDFNLLVVKDESEVLYLVFAAALNGL